jgi:hypothetical protein
VELRCSPIKCVKLQINYLTMKTIKKYLFIVGASVALSLAPTSKSQAQIGIVLEIIKAAIRAIDLQVQRVQNHTIGLQNVQKEIENELSKLKLDEIGAWAQKQKDLYSEYFDELWRVKNILAYYKRISDIIEKQKELVAEYKQAFSLIQKDNHFSSQEISYIYSVYSGIIDASLKNIDQIFTILESFTVQMSDAERLKILNQCGDDIEKQISDLRRFTNENILLSTQRAKDLSDLNSIKQLYGIQ